MAGKQDYIYADTHFSFQVSEFVAAGEKSAKKARATFSKLETGQRFDDFCVPRIYRYLFISFSIPISKMS